MHGQGFFLLLTFGGVVLMVFSLHICPCVQKRGGQMLTRLMGALQEVSQQPCWCLGPP